MSVRLAAFLLLSALLPAAERRALVIGIDVYQTHPVGRTTPAEAAASEHSTHVPRPPARGGGGNGSADQRLLTLAKPGDILSLHGAVADAQLMRRVLTDRYGFSPANIVFLTDRRTAGSIAEVATAQRILDTFQRHLIDEATRGDTSVFFFAGHGSRIRNRAADQYDPPDLDGMDQTFVPADFEDGVPDIRDKELVRLYRQAAWKGVKLTVIFDSCHSGGMVRGAGPAPKVREIQPDSRWVMDPPDLDPKTHKPLPDPTRQGVLVIAAAKDTEAAMEMECEGEHHGVFTYFFTKAIAASAVNESASRLLARTTALMRSAGKMQLPIMAGKGKLTLFGQPAGSQTGLTVPVEAVRPDGTVILHGGVAMGLSQGSELVREGGPVARLRVEDLTLANATARIVQGEPRSGEMFRMDRWVVAPDQVTRFYLPSAGLPSLDALKSFQAMVQELAKGPGIKLVDDPTATPPTDILRFDTGKWELESRGTEGVRRSDLGMRPAAADIAKALGPRPHALFVDYPAPRELAERIRARRNQGGDAIALVDRREEALYQLTGAWRQAGPAYAWVLANATDADRATLPIPVRTDWIAAEAGDVADRLVELTTSLARLRLWLQIEVPGGADHPFPYSLALKNTATGELKTSGEFVEDEKYQVVLKLNRELLASTQGPFQRWVYVVAIDSDGRMQRLFPLAENYSGNQLPKGDPPDEIPLPSTQMTISTPFGTDTLILLASEEAVDPLALDMDPVRTDAGRSRGANPSGLSAFLFQIQGSTRGKATPAPTNWSVERLTFRTVPKPHIPRGIPPDEIGGFFVLQKIQNW